MPDEFGWPVTVPDTRLEGAPGGGLGLFGFDGDVGEGELFGEFFDFSANFGELGGDFVSHSIAEIVLSGVAGEVPEWQHRQHGPPRRPCRKWPRTEPLRVSC